MKRFDLQGIDLGVPSRRAFAYVADPANLPAWTRAFASVDGSEAIMRTPEGEMPVRVAVLSDETHGTVDWKIAFPDGSEAVAYSRIVPLEEGRCVYCFVLTPPPVPLEQLEGALEEQSRTLTEELRTLKRILEDGRR